MKSTETPFLADLFAISFRWLILTGFVISLGMADQIGIYALVIVGLSALWNMFAITLAILSRRLPGHRVINVTLDICLSFAMFFASGGISGPLIWAGLLAISSAGLYFELRGALLITFIISLLQTTHAYVFITRNFPQDFYLLLVINFSIGLAAGFLSLPLLARLRHTYRKLVEQRRNAEERIRQVEHDRMKALFHITETLSGTLNFETVLHSALDGSVTAIGASEDESHALVSAFLLFQDGKLHMIASRGFPSRDQNTTLPAEQGAIHTVLRSANPQIVSTPGQDPELSSFIALQDTNAVLLLPLIRGLNAFGILLFAHPNPTFFSPDRRDMLEMVSHQAVTAIQNARLFQDLAQEKERIVQTQEDAQKKLARDLHDGPTQSIAAIAMRLNIAQKISTTNPGEMADELKKIEDLARRTSQEIRHMLFTLRPLVLETEGLEAALTTIAEKMHELYQQKVNVAIDPNIIQELDLPRQTVIFYLCEEALNNARKHANAAEINLQLRYLQNEPHIVYLEIQDNGVGFDPKQVLSTYERRGSLGMVNLRERSDLINALLKVESAPGKGTRIRVFIPLNQEGIDRLHRLA